MNADLQVSGGRGTAAKCCTGNSAATWALKAMFPFLLPNGFSFSE